MAVSAQEMVDLYIEAEKAVLVAKEMGFKDRKTVMAELRDITANREKWERRLAAERRAAHGESGFSLANFS
ncbi:primosomal replication protein PriB/PriC domain protein [Pseudomonas sp. NPDC098740]|uniref:primosomal replication protein PriB/PriC domain protein n=1 Tax=Pseudomonas sp. NPDC098740 TaxID=3364486 RepID=UPI00383AFF27